MNTIIKRRDFLKAGGAVVAGGALAGLAGPTVSAAETVKSSSPAAAERGWLIGVQQYTFRRFSFYEMVDMMVELGIANAEPGFFLALDKARPQLKVNEGLSAAERKELKQRMADRGIAMPSFYANVGADAVHARKVFEFCKEMGAGSIVAEPPGETLDAIEKLCDEFEIDLAIHNHPKSPHSKYWSPDDVLAVCKGRGKRIGSCSDTGHWVRSGLDPVECLKKLEGRILGFHLKDVIEKGNPGARDVPLGEGKADYAAVLAELNRQDYRGVMMIEYEHDSPELVDDVAKCVAFVEKTAKTFG